MSCRFLSKHGCSKIGIHFSGLKQVYAQQTSDYREEAGGGVKSESFSSQPAKVFLTSHVYDATDDGCGDKGYHDHFQRVQKERSQKTCSVLEIIKPCRFAFNPFGQVVGGNP